MWIILFPEPVERAGFSAQHAPSFDIHEEFFFTCWISFLQARCCQKLKSAGPYKLSVKKKNNREFTQQVYGTRGSQPLHLAVHPDVHGVNSQQPNRPSLRPGWDADSHSSYCWAGAQATGRIHRSGYGWGSCCNYCNCSLFCLVWQPESIPLITSRFLEL